MVSGKALVTRVSGDQAQFKLEDIIIDHLEDDQVLVRIESVAQNPTDVQSLLVNAFGEGAVLGCDFTGIVTQLGKKVSLLKTGDRVAGLIWGGEVKGLGAYSEYTVANENICYKVPEAISSDSAATIPLAAATAFLALFSSQCLNIKRGSALSGTLLVWGGSSSVGAYALQIAKAFSIPVVTTCSPKHFDLCKSLGASQTFDYRDENCADNIRSAVPDISYVFDCIGTESSSTTGSKTVRSDGGTLCTVRPGKAMTENVASHVEVRDVLVWTVFIKDHQYKQLKWPASKEDHTLGSELFQRIPDWLRNGTIKPNTVKVLPGGLDAVSEGFKMHRDGKISGFKIVYNP